MQEAILFRKRCRPTSAALMVLLLASWPCCTASSLKNEASIVTLPVSCAKAHEPRRCWLQVCLSRVSRSTIFHTYWSAQSSAHADGTSSTQMSSSRGSCFVGAAGLPGHGFRLDAQASRAHRPPRTLDALCSERLVRPLTQRATGCTQDLG